MGALELQIFVSLMVVLGAAFVALICDFLKGNNEKLREFNVELLVRQQERERAETSRERTRTSVQTAAPIQPLLAQKPLAHRQAEPEWQAAQEAAALLAEGMPANPRRRRGYRSDPAKHADAVVPVPGAHVVEHRPVTDAMEDWARRVVERQAAGRPETVVPVPEPVATEVGPPSVSQVAEQHRVLEPAAPQELYPIPGASVVPPQTSVAAFATEAVFVSSGEELSPGPSMELVEDDQGVQQANARVPEPAAPQELQPIADGAALPPQAAVAAFAPEAVFASASDEISAEPSMTLVMDDQVGPQATSKAVEPPAPQELQPIAEGSALPLQAAVAGFAPEAVFVSAGEEVSSCPSMTSVMDDQGGPQATAKAAEPPAPQELQPIAEGSALPPQAAVVAFAPEAVFVSASEEAISGPSMNSVSADQGATQASANAPEPAAPQELQPIAEGAALPPQAAVAAFEALAAFVSTSEEVSAIPSMASAGDDLNRPHVNGLAEGSLAQIETPAAAAAPSLREMDPPVLVVRREAEGPAAASEPADPRFTEIAGLASLELKPVAAKSAAAGIESCSLPFAAGQPAGGFALDRTVQLSPPDWNAPAEAGSATETPLVEAVVSETPSIVDSSIVELEPATAEVAAWSEIVIDEAAAEFEDEAPAELPEEQVVRVRVLDEGELIGMGREMVLSVEPVRPVTAQKVPSLAPAAPPAFVPVVPVGLLSLAVDRIEIEVQPEAPVADEPVMADLDELVPGIELVMEAVQPEVASVDEPVLVELEALVPEIEPVMEAVQPEVAPADEPVLIELEALVPEIEPVMEAVQPEVAPADEPVLIELEALVPEIEPVIEAVQPEEAPADEPVLIELEALVPEIEPVIEAVQPEEAPADEPILIELEALVPEIEPVIEAVQPEEAPVDEPFLVELEALVPEIESVMEAIQPEEAGIESFIEFETVPEMRPKVVQMPVPAMSTQQESPVLLGGQLPQGIWDSPLLTELLERDVRHEGVVFSIGIVGFEELIAEHGRPAVKQSMAEATDYFESLMDGQGFGCWAEESLFVMALPAANAEEARLISQHVSEGLWDYQLRSLGGMPLIFHWGSAESANEPMRLALDLAREQMVESGRARKQVLSASGRFRRRVVNA